ncbi:MAG: purine-nucleoside phosphorylase [candidate division WOR-3 bacterium]
MAFEDRSFESLRESKEYIIKKVNFENFDIGIILGSGLGDVSESIENPVRILYKDIPNFPTSTVKGHSGDLVCGQIKEKKVCVMNGRFHYYEGYDMDKVTFGTKLLCLLGIKILIVTNAAGGVNPLFKRGDIMIITDHINFFPEHPLRGPNDERFGPRFVDMFNTYDKTLVEKTEDIALRMGIMIRKGVYFGLQGPTFETGAEYRMIRILGADAVGMSTVPEVIVAKWMGRKILGLSVITDMCLPDAMEEVSHEVVLEAANKAAPKLSKLIVEVVKEI